MKEEITTKTAEPIFCPFCGNDFIEAIEEPGGTWGVRCNFCNGNVTGYKTRQYAVSQWNHRYNHKEENGGF